MSNPADAEFAGDPIALLLQPHYERRRPAVEARSGETATNELAYFLTETLARQVEAEEAIHNGDISPRMEMWSTEDPVTLFGAWGANNSDREDVSRNFHWVASRFSSCTACSFDLVATVGSEHSSMSSTAAPVGPNRATHVYRRENSEWKIVHRHADHHPCGPEPSRRNVSSRELNYSLTGIRAGRPTLAMFRVKQVDLF
jgi:ketosteroid isomerase-like protein